MDKARKKKLKRIIAAVCAVAVVILLAAMPLIAGNHADSDGPEASILSGTVQTGSIDTELVGGGTLTETDAVTIDIPASVKLTGFLVSNGDTVTAGDPIAAVDRVTVMTAIAEVQETLDYLAEQIEAEREKENDEKVIALAGGTVKILYAEKGQSVQDVMLEHGALAVLSLDGLMAVDLTVESDLAVGSAVTVIFSDGKTADGKVEKNLAGAVTVTLKDSNYNVGDAVQVTAEDGTELGSGELYIYSSWNATAYAGTVSAVKVCEGKTVKAGDTLMTLTDVGYTAAYHQLVSQRQVYEDLMLDLFRMYQTQQITAPCDGVVSGVDQNSVQLLAAGEQSYVLSFLANAPDGNDEVSCTNFVAQVAAVDGGNWNLYVNPESLAIIDYKDLSGVSADPAAMTQQATLAAEIPVYALENGEWVSVEARAGDILLIASDDAGTPVWAVRIKAGEVPVPDETEPPTEPETEPPTEPETKPTEPEIPETEPTTPTEPAPSDPSVPTEPSNPTIPEGNLPSTGNGGGFPSGGGSWGSSGGMGSINGMTDEFPMTQEDVFELYGLDMAQIAAVTPQDTMTMDITIDELDINSLRLGMTAEVKINALGGEKVTATITQIGNTGTNNGGNSKFTVELTMERLENMLSGMNATASIVLKTTADVLTLPADALVEKGTRTLVYTGYDEENDLLLNPVEVVIGVSDGKTVEILDGMASGETYYYAYYDTLEISNTPDFGGGMMFGR